MPTAWLPALPLGVFSFSPAKNRFIDRQYQGFPDGAWLATGLISLMQQPGNPPGMNRKP
jgi:hypothetical protein